MNTFVRVSRRDPRYLECSDGTPYVPIGFNLVGVPAPEEFEATVTRMAENGINFVRVWVGHTVFDVEHEKSGNYDLAPLAHLRRFLALARDKGIRVKLCLEFFRDIPAEATLWSDRPLHHTANGGPFEGMGTFSRRRRASHSSSASSPGIASISATTRPSSAGSCGTR
jgi:hypothetical protein